MRRVLMVSSMLALIGVVQSVALVRYLHHHEHYELEPLQTAMFMQLVIAGHLLLFSTLASGFFFQPPFPEWKFFAAVMGTQVLAACMAASAGSSPPFPGASSASFGFTISFGFS
jgi:H+-transporting ATPase